MDVELNKPSGLLVHQESAIIVAESHDVWSFTPEFLLANEIVSDDWSCRRATRRQDTMEIQYGPIRWYMTESNLWIDLHPGCSIEDRRSMEDENLVPTMAGIYLGKVPYCPVRSLWFYWRISVVQSQSTSMDAK